MKKKKPVKNLGGRPSAYDEKYISAVDTYLDECQDEYIRLGKLSVNLPTIQGFAGFIEIDKTTLYDWEKQHPKFSHALEKIRIEQHRRLVDQGLAGNYNSTIAKLMLMNNHAYAEKSENKTEHVGLGAMFDRVAKIIDEEKSE